MNQEILDSFLRLKTYCEKEDFAGWDPYDGLNSKVFKAMPFLNKSPFCRLAMIQAFKRCPINLRKLAVVPKEHNAKGIGLFLQGYCNLYKLIKSQEAEVAGIGSESELLEKINYLAEMLLDMRSDKKFPGEYHGACWGYNFDWQARGGLYFPAHTPTVVATNFCATALMDAYEVTGNHQYLDVALSSAEFVLNDLHRYERNGGYLFSYSKLPGNDTVYNASLLGSKLLSYCYHYTGKEEYKEAARKSVIACCAGQNDDGSWVYGMRPTQNWIDSYHTGYNLDALIAYEEMTGDTSFHSYLDKGYQYYIQNFFENDGCPIHFIGRKYPIDIHCPGQILVTMSRLHKYGNDRDLADKVLSWAIKNMQSRDGYFYYQLKKGLSSKMSYMRWSNAFMFNAISYYLLETK